VRRDDNYPSNDATNNATATTYALPIPPAFTEGAAPAGGDMRGMILVFGSLMITSVLLFGDVFGLGLFL
jgi:hypothetical protein